MSDAWVYEVHDLAKRHDAAFSLSIDRLDVAAGEVLCLVGPTGSGKSTLLRLLAGVDAADSGEIRLLGERLSDNEALLDRKRQMTLVFQRPLMLAGSVRANVAYPLRLRGQNRRQDTAIEQLLQRLQLADLAGQPAQTLSGGQTQLVALARALVAQPRVLLIDEPTASLDPARVALVERVLAEDHAQRATTIVWATHNLFQARRVADRVALLLGGRLIELAPMAQFFESPADPRTADFVQGKMIY